jgi:hypothetical protein
MDNFRVELELIETLNGWETLTGVFSVIAKDNNKLILEDKATGRYYVISDKNSIKYI